MADNDTGFLEHAAREFETPEQHVEAVRANLDKIEELVADTRNRLDHLAKRN